MNTDRLRPKVVLCWGIVLTAVGALLVIFLPDIGWVLTHSSNPSKGVQAILVGFSEAAWLVNVVLVPLGVVLIGAGIVMAFIQRLPAVAVHDTEQAPDPEREG
jgi:multisubunit Na+/H+ antiporter MnhB subunit